METIEYLISQYLDGELSDKETKELFLQLAADKQANLLFQQHLQIKYRLKEYYETIQIPSFPEKVAEKKTKVLYWWSSAAGIAAIFLLVLLIFSYARLNRMQQEYQKITGTLTELKELVQTLNNTNVLLTDQNKSLMKPVEPQKRKMETKKSMPVEKKAPIARKPYLAKQQEQTVIQITQAEYIHKPMIGN